MKKHCKASLRRQRSLSQQLLIGLGVAASLVGCGVFWISHELTKADLKTQVQERAKTIVRSLEFATEGLIEINNTVVLQRVVQNYATLDAVREITVVSPQGTILAHNQPQFNNHGYSSIHPELSEIWHTASQTNQESTHTITLDNQTLLVQVNPFSSVLFGATGQRGVAIAILDLETMQQGVQTTFLTSLLILCVGLLAIVGLMWLLLQRIVLHPLRQLNQAVTQGGETGIIDLNQPILRPDNEIGFLAQTFAQVFEQRTIVEQALRKSEASERRKTAKLKQTLTELQQTQAQLIQTEKMSSLGQLVAGVAHEINNPVAFIHGNISHTEEYVNDFMSIIAAYQTAYPHPVAEVQNILDNVDFEFSKKDFPKLLQSMRFGTQRIREIVVSLRTFSRLDEAELKEVTLQDNVDSALTILQYRLKKTGIEVIKDYASIPPLYCYAGPLNQVFMNLLSNAIDALESHPVESPQICIQTAQLPDRRVAIYITDNGSGMTPETQAKLFEPFFTTKPVGKGTGLGLAISYQIIVERHQGRLFCQSELGKGTRFTIEIPMLLFSSNSIN
ncbi:MAG: ATP-binding protein [Jaaginema sp. PMC 1079.18]|nr:ATP-binding protein [Jaaginema sp. PMC 1080.18]MEC4851852.1 ATP-binding protein [Jaaginema sp. PMC 1079.18]MEC4868922.1 ATP-binding protein [Jaaginema sp. PMC 1078.18]